MKRNHRLLGVQLCRLSARGLFTSSIARRAPVFRSNSQRSASGCHTLFRYADVLLMRAEAKERLGLDGSADFNAVRARVGAAPRECTLANILDERLLELCWEGWRRPDLIRFGQYKSLYEGPGAVDESDGHTTVFPIPADVRALNQNLTQNPGY